MTESRALLNSQAFQTAKADLLKSVADSASRLRATGVRGSTSPEAKEAYLAMIDAFQKDRGRDLAYPFLSSGLGAGPYVELMDGSVKLDLITGIGVQLFGHAHPDLMAESIDAIAADPMQGNLQPGNEARELVAALIKRVGADSKLKHAWLTTCGTMANEIALKIIRQKKSPATRVLAFEDCFAGRSTAMQEITDNPGYRQGQPTYGEASWLPFYDSALGLDRSVERTLERMSWELSRHGAKTAALMIELVQGEGGFRFAPRDWYVRVFEAAKKAGLALWIDEIQTFGRTGELFAYQTLGLTEFPDVVTIAKPLQGGATLFSADYNPKPGLVAGTFTGSSACLRMGRRTLELLDQGCLGKEGRIAKLGARFAANLDRLAQGSCKGLIGERRCVGGMISFVPLDGSLEKAKKVLARLFDLGAMAFYCGHGPHLIRMLPALGAMTEEEVDLACSFLEKSLIETAQQPESGKQGQ